MKYRRRSHALWSRALLLIALSLVAVLCLAPPQKALTQEAAKAKSIVPTATRQADVRKLLDETFELPKANTAAKKQQAAQKLMEMAGNPATAGDELYVVLVTALPLLRETGEFPTYLAAVEQLTDSFQVDAEAERIKHVTDFTAACKSSTTLEPVSNEVVAMAGRAARENRYRVANELLDAADKQSKRITATKLSKSLTEVRGTLREREGAFIAQTQAQRILAGKPDDPKANFAVGLWLAVYESDWERALPKLALGSDAKWKAAAIAEPKSPSEVEAQLSAADAWWEVAQSATGEAKVAAQRRAHEWYERHEPSAKSPLVKARVTKRLEELAASFEVASQRTFTSSSQSKSATNAANTANELPIGKWIDLLEMVKLPEHTLIGRWKKDESSLTCEPDRDVRFMAPVSIRGNYELSCEFTRRSGREFVEIAIPVGLSSCSVVLGGGEGAVSGLMLVDGREIGDLPVNTGAVVRPGTLTNNRRYRLHIEVFQEGEVAAVIANLDGQKLIDWKGNPSRLSISPHHFTPCSQAVAILTRQNITDIHKLELRLKQGGKGCQLGDDWKNPNTQIADVPPKEIAAKCLTWKGRRYFMSEKSMTFPEAQRMAIQLQGRLLTISSAEEEAFIREQGRGLNFWMAGWRRANSNEWRDERNRPLRYLGKWGSPGQPSLGERESNLELRTAPSGPPGWYDDVPWGTGPHACIEWGEEYAGDKDDVSQASEANLFEELTHRGKFLPIPIGKVATFVSTKQMFDDGNHDHQKLIFPDWSPKVFEGVPFVLIDPQGDRIPNAIMLHGTNGEKPPRMPKSVSLPCNAPAKLIHFLGGISGWGFPATPAGTPTLTVRLKYADGQTEDHVTKNGDVWTDYIPKVDVPGSKFAYRLRDQHIRYFTVQPKRTEKIATIELVKGNDATSPIIMAVTVERP